MWTGDLITPRNGSSDQGLSSPRTVCQFPAQQSKTGSQFDDRLANKFESDVADTTKSASATVGVAVWGLGFQVTVVLVVPVRAAVNGGPAGGPG